MNAALWFLVGGGALTVITLGGSMLNRMPMSTSMLYLLVGLAVGPLGLALAAPRLRFDAAMVEQVTEVIVLLSLFTSGLKMSAGLRDRRWGPPLRLALLSMLATVALIAGVGVLALGLPVGAAVLLGGILAPTDPVLATEVQLSDPADRDRLRFALTGEGGLNDGTAFPFVLLGLGLLGLHDIGRFGWRWLAVDLVWGAAVGIAIGAAAGSSVGWLVVYLRRRHKEALGHDNFLALGLIGLSYGLATLAHGYGFLAVFAAGLALRHMEQRTTAAATAPQPVAPGARADGAAAGNAPRAEAGAEARAEAGADAGSDAGGSDAVGAEALAASIAVARVRHQPARAETLTAELATHAQHASAFMAHAVLTFNEQLDHFGELVGVVLIGLLLWAVPPHAAAWWFVPLVLLAIRPLSVAIGLAGSNTSRLQRRLIGWFGIRGIGSLYYLSYALNHGLSGPVAQALTELTFAVVVASILVHGVSVTPLMKLYTQRKRHG